MGKFAIILNEKIELDYDYESDTTVDDVKNILLPNLYSEFWTTFDYKTMKIIELPKKHGRLIDADKFLAVLSDIRAKCIYDREAYMVNLIAEELNKAPTIIEAEGE